MSRKSFLKERASAGAGPRSRALIMVLALVALLAACVPVERMPVAAAPTRTSKPNTPARAAANRPTATIPIPAKARIGVYENADLGIAFEYPATWNATPGEDESTLTWIRDSSGEVQVVAFHGPMPADTALEQAAQQVRDSVTARLTDVKQHADKATKQADGREGWISEFSGTRSDGATILVVVTSTARAGRLVSLMAFGMAESIERERTALTEMAASVTLSAPQVNGIPRDQALIRLGGESNNPRVYDPGTGGGDDLVFSGLVMFNPQLEVVPDLAESWTVSPDGTVYTFGLRSNARFHDGRAVTAQDVIYSWERAADPKLASDTVLTYLGDIVGMRERRAGEAEHVRGLKALDEHTLQVTIDAPKPYFLMKLTYRVSAIVDRANVKSGPEWYRTPNGTGPYKLIRWDRFKLQVYERNEDFYLSPPAIRYMIVQLYAGMGVRLYETGDIDLTGVGLYDAERMRDPSEPLNRELVEGVSMCTSMTMFDVAQPPFDDPKVRQAFALAIDKQRYVDVVQLGVGLVAQGLYPPALPGYNRALTGQTFNRERARQLLGESKYGVAAKLPRIVFTSSGFGSDVGVNVAALIEMWEQNLGVSVEVENLEPDKYHDKLHQGEHGQLYSYGWCADYPDPENFADALFHSQAQQNIGHYRNPELDTLLEQARVEGDVAKRMAMYQQAEQMIIEDAPALFMSHGLSFVLVKPHVNGYVFTPIAVPIERYLSLDASKMK